jgi:hypothetical protein
MSGKIMALKNMITKQEKQRALEHEISMFNITYKAICSNTYNNSWFFRELLKESFIIHTRVLIDFFYRDKRKDDIVAQDFLPDNKNWNNLRLQKAGILETAWKKANKQLAHLTETRIKQRKLGEENWKGSEIFIEMNKVIDCFNKEINN